MENSFLSLLFTGWHEPYYAWLLRATTVGAANLIYGASVLLVCAVISALLYRLGRRLLVSGAELLIKRLSSQALSALKGGRFFSYPSCYLPLLVCKFNLDALLDRLGTPLPFLEKIYGIIAVVLLVLMLNAVLNTVVYLNKHSNHSKPIRGLLQFIQIIASFVAAIVCIAILAEREPMTLVAGLGAASAIVMLIFKDSITSLVAGVQLSFNHLRIGDWVSLPKYDVDGEIYDITLTSVKIRNWDKSVSMVPIYSLVMSDMVKNWRYMKDFGARRITRTLTVDVHSVQFCTPQALERYLKLEGVGAALEKIKMLDGVPTTNLSGYRGGLTNLGILRAYMVYMLEQSPYVRHDLGVTVRQRAQLSGIPLEVVCFANTIDSQEYEDIQSNLFDHFFAVAPLFDLRLFQPAVVMAE